MAKARRVERLQALILRTVATTAQREIRDPRIGIVSITRVKLSADLSHAVVFWSCLGEDPERRTTARGLEHALPALQRAVAGAMQTRVTPRLTLRFDPGMERAQRLEEIFHGLQIERGGEDRPDDEDEDDEDEDEDADEADTDGGAPRAPDEDPPG